MFHKVTLLSTGPWPPEAALFVDGSGEEEGGSGTTELAAFMRRYCRVRCSFSHLITWASTP